MTVNAFRRILYLTAKLAGDAQALLSRRKGAILKRTGRRIVGKFTGRAIGGMFR